jgi:membrane-bound serine protease (ClpP class)
MNVRSASAASSHVDVTVLNYDIGQVSERVLTRAINTAEHDGARALVIEIDTPGGDIDAMKTMTQAELASTVPIISYVSPTGGRAASAGAFIALAAPLVAMAPTTRIGASSPVTSTGSNIDSTLKAKIENDLTAAMTGLQTRYGRNVPLATSMVTQAKSYDDVTALNDHIVDLGGHSAASLLTLLDNVNGRTIKLASGQTITLQTAGASVQTENATLVDQFYGFLLDPNVAFILFVVAMIGIYIEVSHPGAILPGVTGAIALLLFLLTAGSLAPNWAGLALMGLAFVLLVLDVRVPTHGVLTIGAVVSLVVGSLLFFNGGAPEGPKINPLVVYIVSGCIGVLGLTIVTFMLRSRRLRVTTGVESMIGAKVTALTPLLPEGRVSYGGENWAAILNDPSREVDPGTVLVITAVQGLRLHVQPIPIHPVLPGRHDPILK